MPGGRSGAGTVDAPTACPEARGYVRGVRRPGVILRLWLLARVARFLAYVPILGWRFSDSIQGIVTDAIDEEIEVESVEIEFAGGAPPTSMETEFRIGNSLPTDVSVTGLDVRIGFTERGKTLYNHRWSEDAGGPPPRNVVTDVIETDETGTVTVEQYLPWSDVPEDTVHVDGTLEVQTWLDVPATKRVPVGSVHRELPDTSREIPGTSRDAPR